MIKMTWIKRCLMLLLAYCLAACASNSGSVWNPPYQGERDFFPGGVGVYSYGNGQTKENFSNIERAQSSYSPFQKDRSWTDFGGTRVPSANLLGLNAYYPLHVRWKLKDGREFMLENIDIRAIMREYFKTNKQTIQLQWQRENRKRDPVGDYDDATLIHDIKDDTLILKWHVVINRTPPGQRLLPNGAATRWNLVDEQYVITTIPGVPTQGLNFNERWEFNRPVKSVK